MYLSIIVVALFANVRLGSTARQDEGLCKPVSGPIPAPESCKQKGYHTGPPSVLFNSGDAQETFVTTFVQCVDTCHGFLGCKAISFDYSSNVCKFYNNYKVNIGFVSDPSSTVYYADFDCYKCPCCPNAFPNSMIDKPHFEFSPNSSPWILYTASQNQVAKPGSPWGPFYQGHHDVLTIPPNNQQPVSIAQHFHVCARNYSLKFDYQFVLRRKSYLNVTVGLLQGPQYSLTKSLYGPVGTGGNIQDAQWYRAQLFFNVPVAAPNPPNPPNPNAQDFAAYIRINGYNLDKASQNILIDNVIIDCNKTKVNPY